MLTTEVDHLSHWRVLLCIEAGFREDVGEVLRAALPDGSGDHQ